MEQSKTQQKPPKPWDGTTLINNVWHKRGRHGLVFMWINNEWVRSTKTPYEMDNYRDRYDRS